MTADVANGLQWLSAVFTAAALVYVLAAHRSPRFLTAKPASAYALGVATVIVVHRWVVVFRNELPDLVREVFTRGSFTAVEAILVLAAFVLLLRGSDLGR